MWLLRIFNPVKLFYALAAAAVVAVVMSLPLILMGYAHWVPRLAVVIGLPVSFFFLWSQHRDTMCTACTSVAKPFASQCQKCHDWLPFSGTAPQRMTLARPVSWNQGSAVLTRNWRQGR